MCTVKAQILYFVYRENRRSKFVKGDGFTKFFKIKEKIEVHVGSQHSDCVEKAVALKKRFENLEGTLPYLTDSLKAENVRKNREILKWLIKVNILCAKQSIAFREHKEDFLAILKLLAETNEPLRGHNYRKRFATGKSRKGDKSC